MAALNLSVGDRTEELLQFVTSNIDDKTLNNVEIDREVQKPDTLASEPITTAAVITLATALVPVVLRLIERWIESERQVKTLKIVADGFVVSDEVGKQLLDLAKRYPSVSVDFGPIKDTSNQ